MTTSKYGLHTIDYSVQGWDTIMNTDMAQLDSVIHTNLLATLGETVGQYKAVGLFIGETKYKLAKADGILQPAAGLTLTTGILDDVINVQRDGLITNAGWSWANGKPIYLDTTSGELTQNPSGAYKQFMGMPHGATSMILSPAVETSAAPVTTTTTTTTSTTTTTTA